MDQDRWRNINRIFHAALDLAPDQRNAFVLTETAEDPALRVEIEQLLKADSRAGSYLESPILGAPFSLPALETTPPLQEGDLLSRRFRICRMLGEGGMGHVYEAFDNDLGVVVALKVIRPEIAGNAEALARFRQEVRLAHSITHPNVCRTYDINRDRILNPEGQSRELVFLTMEYLPGETLAARIRRDGPLPLTEAHNIARQIADALTAAHATGIIHRDIKPANVMLVPERSPSALPGVTHSVSRAVITDFGLARLGGPTADPEAASLTRSFQPIGTLAYMAPEQLQGAPTSSLTDIYAFGLTLFEMCTGQRAFPTDNPLTGLAQRIAGPPPSTRKLVPTLPDVWHRTIEGCLQVDPVRRWQSPVEVVEALAGRPPRPQLSGGIFTLLRNSQKKLFAAAIFLALSVSLSLALLRVYGYWRAPVLDPGALVYVTHVKNKTGEKSFDNLTELMQAGLTQSAHINLLDESRVGDILQQMTKPPDTVITEPIAREIALRAGAVRVVFLEVTGSAGSYTLHADMQEPDSNALNRFRHHSTNSFPWHSDAATISATSTTIPQDLLTAVRDTSNWIRHQAGESRNDIAALDVPPEDVTTSSWQALEEYANAQSLVAQGKKQDAVLHLEEAVKIDPEFARAYADLADNLISMGRQEEGYTAYSAALNSGSGRRLSRKERDFVKGTFASDTHDYLDAERAFRDYSSYFENDFKGWFYQAYPLDMLDRPYEARSVLLRARTLDPNHYGIDGMLVANSLLRNNDEEAHHWIRQLQAEGANDLAYYYQGVDQFIEGNLTESESSFKQLVASGAAPFDHIARAVLIRVEAEQGHIQEALSTDLLAVETERASGDRNNLALRLFDAASLFDRLGKYQECNAAIQEGLHNNSSPDSVIAASAVLGEAIARAPRHYRPSLVATLAQIERSLPPNDQSLISTQARLRVQGELLIANGKADKALAAFQELDKVDAPIEPRDYLARAFRAIAEREKVPAKARSYLVKALEAYEHSAARPAGVWRNPWAYPPGFVADQMSTYLKLARKLQVESRNTDQVKTWLSKANRFQVH